MDLTVDEQTLSNAWGDKKLFSSSKRRSSNWGGGPSGVFGKESNSRREDDEEALTWIALEKLPTYDRVRTSMLEQMQGSRVYRELVDMSNFGPDQRELLVGRVFPAKAEIDNYNFIQKYRERLDRVGLRRPTVEVRYEDLNIEAKCFVGDRSLPTLWNSALNNIEILLSKIGIPVAKKEKVNILQHVSGVIKPGRITLLLGPPGSGKTSLLLALAGALDESLKVDGKVTYNGHTFDEFIPQKTSVYISQHDSHQGELTVRETLDFSAKCQGIGERYHILQELVRREKEQGIRPEPDIDIFMKGAAQPGMSSDFVTDYVMKILGLDICADIPVGDPMRRGISGGQKKRVTTGEMVVGPTHTLFMDEISTGLDSSTTFQIVKCLSDFTHLLQSTIVVSLLQPAPETFDLFDDVILLSEGLVAYHGPINSVLDFFENCGFKCPPRKGTADFLQEVTSRKDQQQYWANKNTPYEFVSVTDISKAFRSSHYGKQIDEELAVPFDKTKSHPAALVTEDTAVPTKQIFKAVFDREYLLMKRNAFIFVFKSTQLSVLGLITLSVFFRTHMHRRNLNDAQIYSGALFFGVVIVMFNGAAEMGMTISRLPVFYRQRDVKFFPAWTYSVSTLVLRAPVSLLESIVWICLTYYPIGFASEPSRFFRQLLLFFCVHQMSSGLFRFIASVCRTIIVTQTGGSFAILIMFALGGFLIPRTSIKPWWIWAYWVSPLAYAQTGIDVNEYLAPEWQKDYILGRSLGVRYLEGAGLFARGYWYWIAVGAMIGFVILFNSLFTLAITYLNPIGKSVTVSREILAEKEANLKGSSAPLLMANPSPPRTLSKSGQSGQGSSFSEMRRSMSNRKVEGEDKVAQRMSKLSLPSQKDSIQSDGLVEREKRGMILPFKPLSISFDDVNYYVDMPAEMKQHGAGTDRLQLLTNITGSFRPGVLTALVGVSGAGKTTLMDVLAGRKTSGYTEGDIRISGFPKNQDTFARISGYCEQNDIHSPQVTVYESILYSGWLRLSPDINDADKKTFADEVMQLVELVSLRNAVIGLPGVTGLSTEQRKRLTIAVELVANPSLIFMDEPTSGLDARAAAIVMRTVRNTVDTGRTVVCTIHQPSIDIFEAFDELLLLKRGGRVIYAGPLGRHSNLLTKYFEALPGVTKIAEGYNPATWMLEVSSVGVEQAMGIDFNDLYNKSDLYKWNKNMVNELKAPPSGAEDLSFATKYPQNMLKQFTTCLWKQHLSYWRSPLYNNVRFIFTFISALLFGTIFWRLGPKRNTQNNIFSVMGAMYGAVLFIGTSNANTVQPMISTERAVFYREKAAGMYSALPYALAQVVIEIPYIFVQVIIYALITYSMIGLEWTAVKFFWYVYFMFCTFSYFTFYGMMAVALTPNGQIAAIFSSFFYSLFNLFSGFIVPRSKLPVWWKWYAYLSPVAWTLYGLIVSQFGDVNESLVAKDGSSTPVKDFIRTYFDFEHKFLPFCAIIIVCYPLLFAFVFMFSLKFFNFQKR